MAPAKPYEIAGAVNGIPVKRYPSHYSVNMMRPQNKHRHIISNKKEAHLISLSRAIEAAAKICPDAYELRFLNHYDFGPYCFDIFFPQALLAVEIGRFDPNQKDWIENKFVRLIEVSHRQALWQSLQTANTILAHARIQIGRLSGFSKKATRASLQPQEQSWRVTELHGRSLSQKHRTPHKFQLFHTMPSAGVCR